MVNLGHPYQIYSNSIAPHDTPGYFDGQYDYSQDDGYYEQPQHNGYDYQNPSAEDCDVHNERYESEQGHFSGFKGILDGSETGSYDYGRSPLNALLKLTVDYNNNPRARSCIMASNLAFKSFVVDDLRGGRTNTAWPILVLVDSEVAPEFPNAELLNGLTRLAENDKTHILALDSSAGKFIRVNVRLGGATNDIRTLGSSLFYINLDQGLFVLVPISTLHGTLTGDVDVISNGTLQGADDFALSRDGNKAWIAKNGLSLLTEIDILSRTTRVFVNSTVLPSIRAVALGWTEILYTSLELFLITGWL
ncbi:hypothetical protein EDB80DRAFT_872804 [Ilyonectria destructans]|nr:hypothetical protein EDB80DRAFT_872804 [Ilyonectria destructans]